MRNLQKKNERTNQSAFQIECIHNYEYFRQYIFRFPHNQQVSILIAFPKVGVNCIGTFMKDDSTIMIKKVNHLEHWIKQIAVRKKMNEMKFGEYIDSSFLGQFDGVIFIKNQEMFGINIGQITISLSQWLHQKPKNKEVKTNIVSHYKNIINDLHHHHIVLEEINISNLAVSCKHNSFIMLLRDKWDISLLGSSDIQQLKVTSVKDNIYLKNIAEIKTVLQQIYKIQNQDQFIFQKLNAEVNQFLQHIYVLSTLYFKQLSEFKLAYQKAFQKEFHFEQNKQITERLIRFYEAINRSSSSNQLLHLQFQSIANKLKTQKQSIILLERISLEQLRLDQTYNLNQKHIQNKNKEQNQSFFHHSQKQKIVLQKNIVKKEIQFENALQNIKVGNNIDKMRWHFDQAKISWRQCEFYRALGHLKKCRNYSAKKSMILSVIELEQGRNYQHLGLVSEAQAHYLRCIQIREQLYGTHSEYLIIPLHNLLHLRMKTDNKQEESAISSRISQLHKLKNSKTKLNHLNCQSAKKAFLIFDQAATSLQNGVTQLQSNQMTNLVTKISKQDFVKWQFQRIPYLLQMYNKAKQIIQKPQVQKKCSPVLKELSQYGQLHILNLFLSLIQFTYQNKKNKLSDLQEIFVIKTIDILQTTNIKMYHNFLFIMSYYWQKNHQYSKGIACIKKMVSYFTQKQSIVSSLHKRLLQLYKRSESSSQLLKFYHQKQIDLGVYELYDCIKFLFQKQQYALLIKYCNRYLKNIRQYSTIAEEDLKHCSLQNKIIDYSQSVSFILTKAYLNCRNYQNSWKIISQLSESSKIKLNLQNYWKIIIKFCILCHQQKQMSFCLQGLNKLILSIHENEQKYEQNQKLKALEKDLWTAMVDCLITHKISDIQVYLSWLLKRGYDIIKDIDKSLLVNYIERISKQSWNTQEWQQLIQIMKGSISSVNCELNQQQSFVFNLQKQCLQTQNDNFVQKHGKFKTAILKNKVIDTDTLQKDIINLIQKVVQCQGRSSHSIIFLHLLLLELTQKAKNHECEMLILFWLVITRSSLIISQQNEYNIISTVEGRQYRLDQLIYQYCSNAQINIRQKTSILSKLWWYQNHIIMIQSLHSKFQRIMISNIAQDQEQNHYSLITSFKIKYFSYFSCKLQDSSLMAALTQKQSELQLQDYYM